jgi:PAS domain S-box-containing protein
MAEKDEALLKTMCKRAEEENGRFKTISDNAVYGKAITDLQGHLLYVNRFFADIHGYSFEELAGRHFSVFHSQEQMEMVDHLIASMMREGHFAPTTVWHLHRNGTEFPMLMSGVLLKDDYGNPQCIAASAIDMTAYHQAEAALRESEALYRSLVENLPQCILRKDLHGRFTFVDTNFCRSLNRNPEEIIGKTDFDFYPKELAEKYRADDVFVIENNSPFECVEENVLPNGEKIVVQVLKTPIHDASGNVIGIQCIFSDITERKRAEQEINEKAFLLDSSSAIIGTCDLNGNMTYVNRAFLDQLGFDTPGEVLRRDFVEFWMVQEHFEEIMTALVSDRRQGRWNDESKIKRKDGSFFDVYVSAVTIVDSYGKPIALMSTSIDITEQKRVEAEKEKLQTQLTQAQKMESVGRLAGGVAHDFNNMLQAILGHAALALQGLPADSPLRESLSEIQKAAQRSADLTRQLLAFARKQTVAPKALDLNATVEGLLKLLRRLIGEDINLAWKPGRKLWPVKLDPSQVDQILANLCVNARDAIADVGEITIETNNTVLDEEYCVRHAGFVPGDYVLLVVRDDGCGMDAETVSHLFEPFFTTKEMGKGTGLGLATVYGAVKQNDGFIDVYSEPGKGSTFKIYFPRYKTDSIEVPVENQRQPVRRGTETILLVEDEEMILKLGHRILVGLGYTVLVANNPNKAIRLVEEHAGRIHLLITDVVMPEINGRELFQRISSLKPSIKCLYMSGYTADVIAHHGILEEGTLFIWKPFMMDSLAEKIREALES